MSVSIQIENCCKRYGKNTVIPDLSLEIKNGEFFTLLGPSGCGKTTLLRMIAGFNSIEGGTIAFDNAVINTLPAHKRNIGMVFQNYAIFPHLTVRENVEYGLKLRKTPKDEMRERTDKMLKLVRMDEYADRLPANLSGGQQQRIALARAIVIQPQVLLMDEPLSNLDAKLRLEMREVIREIQNTIGITTVYVTHDQEEALAISDRIAVMNGGVIQQVGSPLNIYTRPANTFVSTFIGQSNLLSGLTTVNGVCFADGYETTVSGVATAPNTQVCISVRPEEFLVGNTGIAATVQHRTFLGKYIIYRLSLAQGLLMDDANTLEYSQDIGQAQHVFEPGDTVQLVPNAAKLNVFTADGAHSLMEGVTVYGA